MVRIPLIKNKTGVQKLVTEALPLLADGSPIKLAAILDYRYQALWAVSKGKRGMPPPQVKLLCSAMTKKNRKKYDAAALCLAQRDELKGKVES